MTRPITAAALTLSLLGILGAGALALQDRRAVRQTVEARLELPPPTGFARVRGFQ